MIERVSLANLPTPIERMPHLSEFLDGPELFIKRDDLTGLGFGGNKTRKLEFLVQDALTHGCQTLLSTGAVQSNHCRQVAAAAARTGLKCTLVLAGEKPAQAQGNLMLDYLLGARVIFTDKPSRDETLRQAFGQSESEGEKPYLIPYGGSNAIGAQAYALAVSELKAQHLQADAIVFATSSGGTQAGLMLGALQTGFKGEILGISVDLPASEFRQVVVKILNQALALDGSNRVFTADEVRVNDQYCAAGYGVLTAQEIEAIHLFAHQEGILLDPVYTGRAAAGLIDLIREGYFHKGQKVLFWHTGGTPALFAEPYASQLIKAASSWDKV